MVLLTACQPGLEIVQPVESNPEAARQRLAALADAGPVPVVVLGEPGGLSAAERDRLVRSAFAEGVRGLDVSFAPAAAEELSTERLVVVFNPGRTGPSALCQAAPAGDPAPVGEERVAAAFCSGAEPLSVAYGTLEGPSRRDRERLLWRMADALFPDDYEDTYGLGILPDWLSVGVGGSFGF